MVNRNLLLLFTSKKKKTLTNQTINFNFTPILGSSPRTQTAYLNGKIKVSSTVYAEITKGSEYQYDFKNPKVTLTIDDWQTIKDELVELEYQYQILGIGVSNILTSADLEPLQNGDTAIVLDMSLTGSSNGKLTATLKFTF